MINVEMINGNNAAGLESADASGSNAHPRRQWCATCGQLLWITEEKICVFCTAEDQTNKAFDLGEDTQVW